MRNANTGTPSMNHGMGASSSALSWQNTCIPGHAYARQERRTTMATEWNIDEYVHLATSHADFNQAASRDPKQPVIRLMEVGRPAEPAVANIRAKSNQQVTLVDSTCNTISQNIDENSTERPCSPMEADQIMKGVWIIKQSVSGHPYRPSQSDVRHLRRQGGRWRRRRVFTAWFIECLGDGWPEQVDGVQRRWRTVPVSNRIHFMTPIGSLGRNMRLGGGVTAACLKQATGRALVGLSEANRQPDVSGQQPCRTRTGVQFWLLSDTGGGKAVHFLHNSVPQATSPRKMAKSAIRCMRRPRLQADGNPIHSSSFV